LHPAYKDKYFRKARWPEDWIDEALRVIKAEWTSEYKTAPDASDLRLSTDLPGGTRNLFASITGRSTRRAEDSLEEYLEAAPRVTVKDPLAYWNAALASGSEDPALAQMALDYLSIPGIST
ncbi:hypothetical protein K466DRAFT_467951, partial [Polyporus arcularius HHB13444]